MLSTRLNTFLLRSTRRYYAKKQTNKSISSSFKLPEKWPEQERFSSRNLNDHKNQDQIVDSSQSILPSNFISSGRSVTLQHKKTSMFLNITLTSGTYLLTLSKEPSLFYFLSHPNNEEPIRYSDRKYKPIAVRICDRDSNYDINVRKERITLWELFPTMNRNHNLLLDRDEIHIKHVEPQNVMLCVKLGLFGGLSVNWGIDTKDIWIVSEYNPENQCKE